MRENDEKQYFHVCANGADARGNISQPVPFGSLGARERRALLPTREWTIPNNWLVCNGLILPTNYVDIARFESIYGSHNRFRVFLSSPKQREEMMLARMAEHRGVDFEDQEARIRLAQQLRRQYKLTFRQLATLVRLPEAEVRAHVRQAPHPYPLFRQIAAQKCGFCALWR